MPDYYSYLYLYHLTTYTTLKTTRKDPSVFVWTGNPRVNNQFTILHHLHPALCQSYHKIIGKCHPNAPIWVNSTMQSELMWFVDYMAKSNGIHMLKSVKWSPYDRMASTLIAYNDASSMGMGIWFPGKYTGFQCSLPVDGPNDLIFFYEALAVYCAFWLGAMVVTGLQSTLITLTQSTCSPHCRQSLPITRSSWCQWISSSQG